MMQSSCPGLLLVMGSGFMVTTETKQQSSQWKSPNSLRLKEVKQAKSKVKSMLFIFYDIKGIVQEEFALTGQTVSSAY
jgi:hypothetical protein